MITKRGSENMSVTPEEKGSVTPKSKKCLDMKSKTSLLMSPQRTRGSPLSERQNIPSPLRKDKSQISNRLSFTCSKIVQLISKIITSNELLFNFIYKHFC